MFETELRILFALKEHFSVNLGTIIPLQVSVTGLSLTLYLYFLGPGLCGGLVLVGLRERGLAALHSSSFCLPRQRRTQGRVTTSAYRLWLATSMLVCRSKWNTEYNLMRDQHCRHRASAVCHRVVPCQRQQQLSFEGFSRTYNFDSLSQYIEERNNDSLLDVRFP